MREKIEIARRRAIEAKENAGRCTDAHAQREWLIVARLWEDVAREYVLAAELKTRIGTADA